MLKGIEIKISNIENRNNRSISASSFGGRSASRSKTRRDDRSPFREKESKMSKLVKS